MNNRSNYLTFLAEDRGYQTYLTEVVNYIENIKEILSLFFKRNNQLGNEAIVFSNIITLLDSLRYFGEEEDFNDEDTTNLRWNTFNRYKQIINKELELLQDIGAVQKTLSMSVDEFPGIEKITRKFTVIPISYRDHNCFLRCLFNAPDSREDSPRVAKVRRLITRRTNIRDGDFIGVFDNNVIALLQESYGNVLGTLHVHILTHEGGHIELNPIRLGSGEDRHILHTINHFSLLIPKNDAKQEEQKPSASLSSSSRKRRRTRSASYESGSESEEKMLDENKTKTKRRRRGKGRFCSDCDRKFHTLKELKEHAKETKHRSFKCKQCGKSYVNNGSLNSHMYGHEIDLRCRKCGKKLSTKSNLEIHEYNCLNKN